MFNLSNNSSSRIPPAPTFRKGEIILNCKIDNLNAPETLNKISDFLQSKNPHRVITVNSEYILEAQNDEEFKNIINSADLSVPDSIGIIWAAKFLSLPAAQNKILRIPQVVIQYVYTGASLIFLPRYCRDVLTERVSGVDIFEQILTPFYCNHFFKIFLLGGFDNTGERIKEKYPDSVVGTFDGSPSPNDDEKARDAINKAQPNILFVAYGNPASKQEKWISRNLPHLSSVKAAMGVGGSFDFLAGQTRRAPKWMQSMGVEWLWRVVRHPRRAGRIWNAVIVFSFKIFWNKINKDTFVIPNPAKRTRDLFDNIRT